MALRKGVQAEVLLSLALVMITGTGLLAGVFLEVSSARIGALHDLLGRGFVSISQELVFELDPLESGRWWRFDRDGRPIGLNAPVDELDPLTHALAREALASGEAVVQSGAPWDPIRFVALREKTGGALGGRIDAPVSGRVLALLLVADVMIFALLGVTILRRRVVGPLHRLAAAARAIGASEIQDDVPIEGAGEIEALGRAFNDMQTALRARTGALEKAVHDLRTTNATLSQAREGLDRAERLAMVGSLAAGVAHEVGNPMAALLAFLEVAGRDEGLSPESRRCLDKAADQGERVRVILRQLLDFSRPPQVSHGPIEVGAIARQAAELVTAQKQYADIAFDVEVEDGVGLALGDASHASQILLNLAINAAAALEDAPTRRVRLSVRCSVAVRRAEDGADALPDARFDSVEVRVEDSGEGVRLADPGRIFDPFFTTKPPGEGTGLGLANARRLAQEMNGDVSLDAEPSALGGAVFCFRLPRVETRSDAGDGVRA
ncbi:MAG: ATP-binding protein, partial [Myxococcota bacterium]